MSAIAELPPASVGSAVPSSQGEIKVSAMTARASAPAPATPAKSVPPPLVKTEAGAPPVIDDGRKSSERMFADLRKIAKHTNSPNEERAATEAEAAPVAGVVDDPEASIQTGEVAAKEGEKTAAPPDKKKVNPWKVIEEHKEARARLEREVADLKKLVENPETRKSEVEKYASIEKRAQELEEHIKFVDYRKSQEFTDKYQKPYDQAWDRAMGELKELTNTDDQTGVERPMAPADLLELVNLPLLKARELADERYGAAANEVMAYRKEIRGLYEQQSTALENAKKSSVEKASTETATRESQIRSIQQETKQEWESYNQAIQADEKTGQYFKPAEGNEEINQRLASGYKFVDETMAMNPMNPKLTPEQRKEAIHRHASLRARAAAFGRMRHELETSRKELAEVRKKLAGFESSTPDFGGSLSRDGAAPAPGGGMEDLFQKLRKVAR